MSKANLRFLWVVLFLLKTIDKYNEKFPFYDENLLFPEFDNHVILSEAWPSSIGGVSSETFALSTPEIWSKHKFA